ncbi:hypothetical protein GCM10007160_03950 [Litchfieldella qijiaojingensis]|uniref:Uncharacterized protein n=1 Tax=Litchfieldella qijiaojingensis TaxID=980347 RepID=A0ABQ2YDB6_9GAMM|nr:hypothetical protein [Halomonas qijiaojingensis]GGX79759.1 hypothetical protein GCM10007160_03950 [Halomonas qijiaojingensis]
MPIKAGTVNDFEDSMAEAMENALAEEYQILKGEALPDMGQEDRRMLLSAIAQGVVRYLKDNLDAFELSSEVTQVTGEPDAPLIRSENPASIGVSGGGGGSIAAGAADVTQIDSADNRVRSRGSANIDNLNTTGTLYS